MGDDAEEDLGDLTSVDVGAVVGLFRRLEGERHLILGGDGALAARAAVTGRAIDACPGQVPAVGLQRHRLREEQRIALPGAALVDHFVSFGQQFAVALLLATAGAQVEHLHRHINNIQ